MIRKFTARPRRIFMNWKGADVWRLTMNRFMSTSMVAYTINLYTSFPSLKIYIFFYGCRQGGLGHCTNNTFFLLSTFEEEHSWNAPYAILSGSVGAVISVELEAVYLPSIFFCQLVDHRSNHPAWSTPWCPKLHQNWILTCNDKVVPACICHHLNCTIHMNRLIYNLMFMW